ncbi:bifunctional molybdenum cofactor biosynthesis protein MoaC/MoaB [Sinomicrobium oceani]|uniref:bifunctional molybdenum cofactor biosynthesis protein MoaC/MoaB n=1 Tax=Sinomicrobium oceani TaxID=1150368 RepID=UPI00227D0684|nr:bifunctional molybdenum cofactor biosynthesis protein MoaC/MoaB [Sinomicrobium oceani]
MSLKSSVKTSLFGGVNSKYRKAGKTFLFLYFDPCQKKKTAIMVDITHKVMTLRTATAQAEVKAGKKETIAAIRDQLVPKGNVLEMARAAGLFAVKNTSLVIPDCHPLPIEYTAVDYEIGEMSVRIVFTVKTVYKTGVEVEAMHGASVVALTMYDMLKPIDKQIEIGHIKLLEKKGGKSSFSGLPSRPLRAVVVVCSDTISAGEKADKAGKIIIGKLGEFGVEVPVYDIVPDEMDVIRKKAEQYTKDYDLLIFTGGTGLSPRDVTPEALLPVIERRIPGVEEAIRNYGQQRMPYAMLSRSVAGMAADCLVLALPGSSKGAAESMDAVFPHILHLFKVTGGQRHDEEGSVSS